MLYLETAEGFAPWVGQPIADILHSREIETRWTPEALAAIGLFVPVDPGVPEGHRQIGARTVARVNDVVTFVYVTEPIPDPVPGDFILSDRQLRLGLIGAGVLPSTVRNSIAAAIPDDLEREALLTWFDYTRDIRWDHPVTQQLMVIAGFTPETAATMWLAAAQIEA